MDEHGCYNAVLYGDLYTLYDFNITSVFRRTNRKGTTAIKNDVLFPSSTTVDSISLISPACLDINEAETSGCFIIRPKEGINGYFVSLYTKGNSRQRLKLAKNAQGITIIHLYYQLIAEDTIFIPSAEEQTEICDFFSTIFNYEHKLGDKLNALKKYKQGLINNEFNETIMSWKYHNSVGTSLAHFLEEVNETAEKNGIYPHLTLSKDGIQEKTERYDRDFLVSTENKKYKITRLNQLCYNPANLKFGVICLNKYGDGIFSPIYVTFKIENINPIYLESLLTSQNFINYSLKFQEGTVYERMAVSVEDFTKIKIIPSDLVHQNTFSCVIEHIDSLIQIYTAKIAMLENIKNYLLTNMFI